MLLFVADSLACFPYQTQDEPLFIMHHIDITLSVSGSNLLQSFKEVGFFCHFILLFFGYVVFFPLQITTVFFFLCSVFTKRTCAAGKEDKHQKEEEEEEASATMEETQLR